MVHHGLGLAQEDDIVDRGDGTPDVTKRQVEISRVVEVASAQRVDQTEPSHRRLGPPRQPHMHGPA